MSTKYNNYDEYYDDDNNDEEDNNGNQENGIIECSTSFMDSSMYYFPSTSTMQKASNLDFGVICQPLTDQDNEEENEIPLINFNRVLFPLPFSPTTIQNPGFLIEKLHFKIKFSFFSGYEKETSLKWIYGIWSSSESGINSINLCWEKILVF